MWDYSPVQTSMGVGYRSRTERSNASGGVIIFDGPLGASETKLTATLLHDMQRRQSRPGLVDAGVVGGIGAAEAYERI